MSFVLNTLHIFGYGEVQVIGNDGTTNINKKVPASAISGLSAVVDDVYSKKPEENESPNSYHAINIFNDMFADYLPSGEYESWRVPYSELNQASIDAVVAEVLTYQE